MLSVLIPVYNYSIRNLVNTLHQQLTEANINFEIICFDDGSTLEQIVSDNKNIVELPYCFYFQLDKNHGRSYIRNKLAEKAKYDYLLFIDNDSLVVDSSYIKKYLLSISFGHDVIYGGRRHPETIEKDCILRWKYGKHREDLLAEKRLKNKFKCLIFNNTIIKSSVFDAVKFDLRLNSYGHEDTLLAWQLSLLNAKVAHIDNPVIHDEIDTNITFMAKTKSALNNLKYLQEHGILDSDFILFLKYYNRLQFFGFVKILSALYSKFHKKFEKHLCSASPSLLIFDIYRFSYFSYIKLK